MFDVFATPDKSDLTVDAVKNSKGRELKGNILFEITAVRKISTSTRGLVAMTSA